MEQCFHEYHSHQCHTKKYPLPTHSRVNNHQLIQDLKGTRIGGVKLRQGESTSTARKNLNKVLLLLQDLDLT